MSTIAIPGAVRLDVLGQRVYAKLKWEDEWTLREHVHATQVTFSSSPSIGEAVLHYRFGLGRQPGQDQLDVWNPFTLPNLAYVRIDIDVRNIALETEETIHWYGVAGRMVTRRDGSGIEHAIGAGDPEPRAIGTQTLYCASIEWLLDRWPILTSWTNYRPTISQPQIGEVWSGIAFNDQRAPNRSPSKYDVPHLDSFQAYVFGRLNDGPEWWSTRDIIEYLLAFQVPYDIDGNYPIEFGIFDTTALLPTDDVPILPTEGRYTLGLLNQLLSRQRGYGCRWEISDHALDAGADAIVQLVPFTFVGTELELPSGAVIKANPEIRDLDVSGDRNQSITTAEDAFTKFHRVIARGNKMVACFSSIMVGPTSDGQPFKAGWTSAEEIDFKNGYNVDYPLPSEIADQEVAKANFRSLPQFEHVFSRFVFSSYWPGFLDTFASGGSLMSFPYPDDEETQARTYARGLRVLPNLPLVRGLDYADGNTPTVPDVVLDADYISPLTFWRVPASSPAQYVEGRAIPTLAATEAYRDPTGIADNDRGWYSMSIFLRPSESDNEAFWLVVSGADRTHIEAAAGYWSYLGVNAFVTVAVETPYYCEAQADSADPPEDALRIKVIYAGNQYRLDWLAENTIIGLDSARQEIWSGAGRFIRDDRQKLQDIATLALTWYGIDRQPIIYRTSYLNSDLLVGMYIGDLIEPTITVPVNTVITEIAFAFGVARGTNPPLPTMTIRTASAELDLLGG